MGGGEMDDVASRHKKKEATSLREGSNEELRSHALVPTQ